MNIENTEQLKDDETITNELIESIQENTENNNTNLEEKETNLEKTTIIEINPNPENITEEEVKKIGADENWTE